MDTRTPVIVIAGSRSGSRAIAEALLSPGTVAIHHDLTLVAEGVVARTVTTADDERTSLVELEHGCVSCTLRGDLLPLLRRVSDRSNVERIVLQLDPLIEPIEVCEAITDIPVTGIVGRRDAPAGSDVAVIGVLAAIDAETWLHDATSDDSLAEHSQLDDDRTVAQVAVAHVASADTIFVFGNAHPFEADRVSAVLARLSPTADLHWISGDTQLAEVARRLEPRPPMEFDAHAPLLAGQPPLEIDGSIGLLEFNAERPFHPERLHEALDVLLKGVVTARGRVWLATAPSHVVWLESAGGGMRIGPVDKWLAAMTPRELETVDPERRAMAALMWSPEFGDRHTSLTVLVHDADPTEIDRTLTWALVTDSELDAPSEWHRWADPFGEWHQEPCADKSSIPAETSHTQHGNT